MVIADMNFEQSVHNSRYWRQIIHKLDPPCNVRFQYSVGPIWKILCQKTLHGAAFWGTGIFLKSHKVEIC